VHAFDHEDQINKYLGVLTAEAFDAPSTFLIYLTPTGLSPRQGILDQSKLKLLSYQAIGEWIGRQKFPDRLRNVGEMYTETCQKIAGGYMNTEFSSDIAKLLSLPQDFGIALEIAEFIDIQRPRVVEQFWNNVRVSLDELLAKRFYDNHWNIVLSAKNKPEIFFQLTIDYRKSSLKSESTTSIDKPNYAIAAQSYGATQIIGITGPSTDSSSKLNGVHSETQSMLRNMHFKTTHQEWVGWQHMYVRGLVDQSRSRNEWINKLNADNQNAGTPLAIRIANGIWEIFERFHKQLEVLNGAAAA